MPKKHTPGCTQWYPEHVQTPRTILLLFQAHHPDHKKFIMTLVTLIWFARGNDGLEGVILKCDHWYKSISRKDRREWKRNIDTNKDYQDRFIDAYLTTFRQYENEAEKELFIERYRTHFKEDPPVKYLKD